MRIVKMYSTTINIGGVEVENRQSRAVIGKFE